MKYELQKCITYHKKIYIFFQPVLHLIISCYIIFLVADVAQLVEQLICNQQVVGSSPSISSMR